jgi:hypothetical protein
LRRLGGNDPFVIYPSAWQDVRAMVSGMEVGASDQRHSVHSIMVSGVAFGFATSGNC